MSTVLRRRAISLAPASHQVTLQSTILVVVLLALYSLSGSTAHAQTTGYIYTFAGNGVAGYSGDGGSATSASIHYVYPLAFDASGNAYFTDSPGYGGGNATIRKVTTSGVISTLATFPPNQVLDGIAVDAAGNVYVSDYQYTAFGGFAAVYKVTPQGTMTYFIGNGQMGTPQENAVANQTSIHTPNGIVFDAAGNCYVSDPGNGRVYKVTTDGLIHTFAGTVVNTLGYSGDGGQATAAQLGTPIGLAIDSAQNIYIADATDAVVRKVAPGGVITTVAGNYSLRGTSSGDGGQATNAAFIAPYYVAVDPLNNLYISDQVANVARKVDTNGIISTIAGTGVGSQYPGSGYNGDNIPATTANLNQPEGLAIDASGNLYIADTMHYRIREVLQ